MNKLSRRQFLGTSIALAASTNTGFAATKPKAKTLKLYNTHTDETLFACFEENGEMISSNLQQFDYILRDLQTRLGNDNTIEIISGYRTSKTNEMLRGRSSGVAKKSFHTKGRAIDIRIRGVKTRLVRDTAIAMNAGGVGYYQGSDFVHLDTGPVRAW